MSYDVQLYRKEIKDTHTDNNTDDFFENEENLLPFTPEQFEELKSRLISYNFFIEHEKEGMLHFGFADHGGTRALLTKNCLYFSSTGEGIFEISMTASEFTDTGAFAKYDPQQDGWEAF